MYLSIANKGLYYLYYKNPLDNKIKRTKVIPETKNLEEAEIFKSNFIIPNSVVTEVSKSTPLIALAGFIERLYQYLSHNVSDSTYSLYFTTFEDLLKFLGNKLLKDVSALDIENFKYHLSKRMQKITVNKNLRNVRAGFNIAIEKFEILEKNPAIKVEFYRVEKNEIRCLLKEDIEKMLKVIDKPIYKRIFLFLLYTGMRLNECLTLTFADINYQNNSIIIRNKKEIGYTTKNLKYRLLSLTMPIKNIIGIPNLNPDAYVFNNTKKGKYDKDFISMKMKEYSVKAGLKNFKTHNLRHTFATTCIQQGIKIQDLKILLGHSKISTTELYLHTSISDIQESMAKLNYGIDERHILAV